MEISCRRHLPLLSNCPLAIFSSLPMIPLNSPTESTPRAEHSVGLAEEGKLVGSRGPGVKSLGGNGKEVPRGGSEPNLKLTASVRMAAEKRKERRGCCLSLDPPGGGDGVWVHTRRCALVTPPSAPPSTPQAFQPP